MSGPSKQVGRIAQRGTRLELAGGERGAGLVMAAGNGLDCAWSALEPGQSQEPELLLLRPPV